MTYFKKHQVETLLHFFGWQNGCQVMLSFTDWIKNAGKSMHAKIVSFEFSPDDFDERKWLITFLSWPHTFTISKFAQSFLFLRGKCLYPHVLIVEWKVFFLNFQKSTILIQTWDLLVAASHWYHKKWLMLADLTYIYCFFFLPSSPLHVIHFKSWLVVTGQNFAAFVHA